MLLQFSVSNYRAFRDRATLNLAASGRDKSLPENALSLDVPGLKKDQRWLKGVGLYGPNASGKSTLLASIKALCKLVTESASTTDPKDLILPVVPFALTIEDRATPTAFAIAYVNKGIRFEYRLAITRQRVVHESLRAFPKGKEQTWFDRNWSESKGDFEWGPERPQGVARRKDIEARTLPNVLFLSKAIAEANEDLEPAFRWLKEGIQFFDLGRESLLSGFFTKKQIGDRTELSKRIVEILRHGDLGITDVGLAERQSAKVDFNNLSTDTRELMESFFVEPELMHQGKQGAQFSLPWNDESAGTQKLFALAGPWLDILSRGQTACIDELETSMHPLMVRELLRLFFSEKENPKGAQILFTTHNPLLLDPTLMRRDQVWFTDKDEEGVAHLYPLTDYQPRKGESLVRGYLAGRYGAVPFVPEGLLGSFPAHEVAGKKAGADTEADGE